MSKYTFEIWRDIRGYEGLYQISSFGRIKSLKTDMFLKPTLDITGYYRINFRKAGYTKHFNIHRLLLETFVGNPLNKPITNHIDGCKTNNQLSNLEWATYKENLEHATRSGLNKRIYKKKPGKLSEDDVRFIRESKWDRTIISEVFNICKSHVNAIRTFKFWKNVK